MKGPRRLVEQNELFASLVDDARKREPRPEALEKLLDVLESPAAVASPPARKRLGLRAPEPWIWPAVVGAGALALLSYASLERPLEEAPAAATVPASAAPLGAPPAEAVPSFAIADLPDSEDPAARRRPVTARPAASPAVVSSVATASAPKRSTGRELEIIARAREALTKGDTRACLVAIALHDAEFPEGQFMPEAEVMRIEATHASGDRAGARTLARAFLAKHPESPYAARIRSLLAAPEKE